MPNNLAIQPLNKSNRDDLLSLFGKTGGNSQYLRLSDRFTNKELFKLVKDDRPKNLEIFCSF